MRPFGKLRTVAGSRGLCRNHWPPHDSAEYTKSEIAAQGNFREGPGLSHLESRAPLFLHPPGFPCIFLHFRPAGPDSGALCQAQDGRGSRAGSELDALRQTRGIAGADFSVFPPISAHFRLFWRFRAGRRPSTSSGHCWVAGADFSVFPLISAHFRLFWRFRAGRRPPTSSGLCGAGFTGFQDALPLGILQFRNSGPWASSGQAGRVLSTYAIDVREVARGFARGECQQNRGAAPPRLDKSGDSGESRNDGNKAVALPGEQN